MSFPTFMVTWLVVVDADGVDAQEGLASDGQDAALGLSLLVSVANAGKVLSVGGRLDGYPAASVPRDVGAGADKRHVGKRMRERGEGKVVLLYS